MSCTFWQRRKRLAAKKREQEQLQAISEKETVTETNSETAEDKPKKSGKRGVK